MEPELNTKLNEVLGMYGIDSDKAPIIDGLSLVGHLARVAKEVNSPMGVSQWYNHGKKYGYTEFFLRKAQSEE